MGWVEREPYFYKNGKIDKKAECDNLCNWGRYQVIKSSMIGNTYYAAVKDNKDNKIFATIILTQIWGKNKHKTFAYKQMSEECGPCENTCPVSILNLLTPTNDEAALNWRRKCYNKHKKHIPTQKQYLPQMLF